jgi:hypothetical protein
MALSLPRIVDSDMRTENCTKLLRTRIDRLDLPSGNTTLLDTCSSDALEQANLSMPERGQVMRSRQNSVVRHRCQRRLGAQDGPNSGDVNLHVQRGQKAVKGKA